MKKILLAVTGGIAAYKAIDLTSKLTQSGYEVRVMLTNHAQKFVDTISISSNKSKCCLYRYFYRRKSFRNTAYCIR